jgi:hypothetical protein
VRIVLEARHRLLDAPKTLDPHVRAPIHEHVVYRGVLEQRFQRAETEDLVLDLADKPLAILEAEQRPLLLEEDARGLANVVLDLLLAQASDPGEVEVVEQCVVDARLELLPRLIQGRLGGLAAPTGGGCVTVVAGLLGGLLTLSRSNSAI